jgi:uncharacterized protein YcbK (DUF882 family)
MGYGRAQRVSFQLALSASLLLSSFDGAAKAPQRPRARRATGAAYRTHVQKWHALPDETLAPVDSTGRAKLVLENINTQERVALEALADAGGFSDDERKRATAVLGDWPNDRMVDVAVLDLLYRLQQQFEAPCVRIVSAYRAGGSSQHARGLAADIVIPGVADEKLAAFARSLGGTGVGLYPKSGFVHVDVREHPHYWVDSSGPGERSRPARHKVKSKRPTKKKGARTGFQPSTG